MKTVLFAFLFAIGIGLITKPVQGQWLDGFSSALPRVTPLNPSTTGSSWDSGGFAGTDGFSFGTMRQDWRIGVGIENRDIGAVVTQVELGSAAEQAGIMRGDVIVAAGQTRLGLVDNRVVELADVARRSADSFGRISMLVVNQRTGIRNVIVNMKSTANSFSGTLSLRDAVQLPQGSWAVVELRNATRPFYEVQGGKLNQQVAGYGPYSFTMNVDPRFLNPTDQYEVLAAIYVGNQPAYMSQPIRLRLTDLTQPMNLLLERSNLSAASAGGVVSASYPSFGMNTNGLAQELQQLLGRPPNANELGAWGEFLRSGNSLLAMRQRILSNPQLRANYSSDAAYLQHVYTVLKGQPPTQRDLIYWIERLRATGLPETVVAEMMSR
jgi:uncharacterized lipoprotein YbaY